PIYTRRFFEMGKVKFELNLPGLNQLMKSDGMQAHLQEAGEAVAGIADGNYGVRVHQASFVAIANVYPEDRESARKNYEKNELLKATGAAGLPMGK
ncbi:MAG: hypothetical protein IKG01_15125, partial [Lachnospiraceae bacterium]|nr:hypothetical protein [Lachnospiraceae bacterium]